MNNKIIFYTILILTFSRISFSQNKITILEAIRVTMENNQQIKSLRFNIEKEEAASRGSVNIPKLKLFVEYEGIKGGLNNFEERKIGVSQEFEFPTVYSDRASVQNYQIDIARAELESTINNFRSDLKEHYAVLLFSENSLLIAKENLKYYEQFLFTAEQKYKEGAGTNLEMLGARVNKIKFENLVKNLESNIAVSRVELKTIMNTDYTVEAAGSFSFRDYKLNRDFLIQTALANNPELKISKLQKLQSDSRISLAVSEVLPNFSLSYYHQKIGGESGYYGFEIGVGIPFWFWWEPSAKISQSKSEFKVKNSEELNLAKTIESRVIIAHENYQNNLRQLNFFREEALKEAEEITKTSKLSYEEGEIGYSEYLQTLGIANETKTQYLIALYNYNLSLINLERLTGKELQ